VRHHRQVKNKISLSHQRIMIGIWKFLCILQPL
jgi:hypothetical protein